ncbi:MAG: N-acetyl-gamma-glutamyl-phosphate reductase [Candidatus Diapherotrites archaeon]|nr:N-acetyl-gamma-glutamyl-phosphate reductase [Candidatus Diapherotrites archaeon]
MCKKIGIVGHAGFVGMELVKLLQFHSNIKLKTLISNKPANETELNSMVSELNQCDLVFLALPAGQANGYVNKIDTRLIDLSSDNRFNPNFVYGLPEIYSKKIEIAQKVSNPGCYATTAILALLPLNLNKSIDQVVIDGKSGVSGAGKANTDITNFNYLSENIHAYSLTQHKHEKEIQGQLKFPIHFTPHIIPVKRGLLCTSHVLLKKDLNIQEVKKLYENFYANKSFVKIKESIPSLQTVQNTPFIEIGGFEISNKRLVIVSALDNLQKGAASQAIENMNLMFGFKETEGLL